MSVPVPIPVAGGGARESATAGAGRAPASGVIARLRTDRRAQLAAGAVAAGGVVVLALRARNKAKPAQAAGPTETPQDRSAGSGDPAFSEILAALDTNTQAANKLSETVAALPKPASAPSTADLLEQLRAAGLGAGFSMPAPRPQPVYFGDAAPRLSALDLQTAHAQGTPLVIANTAKVTGSLVRRL